MSYDINKSAELSVGTGLYTGASGYYEEISLSSDSNAKTPGQAINGSVSAPGRPAQSWWNQLGCITVLTNASFVLDIA